VFVFSILTAYRLLSFRFNLTISMVVLFLLTVPLELMYTYAAPAGAATLWGLFKIVN
jgi:hypothetical protein